MRHKDTFYDSVRAKSLLHRHKRERRCFSAGLTLAALTLLCACISSTLDVGQHVTRAKPGNAVSMISAESIREFAPTIREDYLEGLNRPEIFIKYDVTTPQRLAHFMAQIAHESAGFKRLDENLNYSAKGLRKVFRTRVSPEQADQLARHPRAIANYVYGNRLGNRGRETDDGWQYRGSGFIQLTGRANFIRYAEVIGADIVSNPDQARTPQAGLLTALAFWDSHGLNALADRNDLCGIRKRINGGLNGVDETLQWYQRARAAFDNDPATQPRADGIDGSADVAEILDILGERGIVVTTYDDPSRNLHEALKIYQKARGLKQTGVLDIETLAAISDHREHDLAFDKC